MKKTLKTALGIILVFALVVSAVPAYAQEEVPAGNGDTTENAAAVEQTAAPEIEHPSILDEEKIQLLVDNLMDTSGISEDRRENISIVYTYLGTGDSWYYNADTWRYPASMYKVPMLMVLAERVAKGELTQESDIGGMTLAKTEDLVLIWSNNEQAHVVRKYLGGDPVARKLYQAYSPQEESYYHSDFIDYCYFTARYMDDVMQTLYNNQSNFPNIMDCLKVAMPDRYYHLNIDPSYVVAQKYGTFKEFNNNTGIIFTPNPFILTVMTEHMSIEAAEAFMGQTAKVFLDYTLEVDKQLAAHQQMIAEAEAKAAEEARLAAEEAERKAREAAEAAAQAERERLAEIERAQKEAEAKARREKFIDIAVKVVAVAVVVGVAVLILLRSYRKKRAAKEAAYEKEMLRRRRYGIDAPDLPSYDDGYDYVELPRRRRSRDEEEYPTRKSTFEQELAPRRRSQELTERYTRRPDHSEQERVSRRRSQREFEDQFAAVHSSDGYEEAPRMSRSYESFDEYDYAMEYMRRQERELERDRPRSQERDYRDYEERESRRSGRSGSDKGGYRPRH
ncbi:MAG: hypothetical protein IJB09_05075 [Oscillospiraceae bacterium]|nr:hypothetical protein [Oscillospiraceae bacterium]